MEAEPLDHLSDDLLAEKFLATSDPAFFAEVFRRHGKTVYQCCLAMLRDRDASADVTQETFIRAMKALPEYSGGHFRAWLLTIARHQCIDHIRARNRGPRSLEDREEIVDPSRFALDLEARDRIQALLSILNDEQQLCLKLFYLNGLTYEEISDLTLFSVGAVKSHIQNGKRRIRNTEPDCRNTP